MSPPRQTEVATSPVLAAVAQLRDAEAALVAAHAAALPALVAELVAGRDYQNAVEGLLNEAGAARASGTLPDGIVFEGAPRYNIDDKKSVAVDGRTIPMRTNVAARLAEGILATARTEVGVHPAPRNVEPLGESFVDGLRRRL